MDSNNLNIVGTVIQMPAPVFYRVIGHDIEDLMEPQEKIRAGLRDYYFLDALYCSTGKLVKDSITNEDIRAAEAKYLNLVSSNDAHFINRATKLLEKAKKKVGLLRESYKTLRWDLFDTIQLVCLDKAVEEDVPAFYNADNNTVYITNSALKSPEWSLKALVHELCHSITAGKESSQYSEGITEYLANEAYQSGRHVYGLNVLLVRTMIEAVGLDRVLEANKNGEMRQILDEGTRPGDGEKLNWILQFANSLGCDGENCPAYYAFFDVFFHYLASHGMASKNGLLYLLVVPPMAKEFEEAYKYFASLFE